MLSVVRPPCTVLKSVCILALPVLSHGKKDIKDEDLSVNRFLMLPPDCHVTAGKSSITVIREQISSPTITATARGLPHFCK